MAKQRTIKDAVDEAKTNCVYDDFPVGTKVKIMTPCQDFHFWYGETGVVTKNTYSYLGIRVKLDTERHYEGGMILTDFGFNPEDLQPIDPLPVSATLHSIAQELNCRSMTKEESIAYRAFIRSMSTPTGLKVE